MWKSANDSNIFIYRVSNALNSNIEGERFARSYKVSNVLFKSPFDPTLMIDKYFHLPKRTEQEEEEEEVSEFIS